MTTLASQLGETTPVSPLIRKARRLGIPSLDCALQLAAARGCHHYRPVNSTSAPVHDPGQAALSDAELTILLILGENPYQPTAIRCAAQLARSPRNLPSALGQLAARYKTQRVLTHIARAGLDHDPLARAFWQELLEHLPPVAQRAEPHLPHWSRFVSMPGFQRNGPAPTLWLVPAV